MPAPDVVIDYGMAGRMAKPFLQEIAWEEIREDLTPAEAATQRDEVLDAALDAAEEIARIEGRPAVLA